MNPYYTNELGKITVDSEVIAMIAGLSTVSCVGVVGMTAKTAKDGLIELLGRESLTKGVIVVTQDNKITIKLFIIVEYGTTIRAVGKNITDTISYNVEKLTGLTVDDIMIKVEGVRV